MTGRLRAFEVACALTVAACCLAGARLWWWEGVLWAGVVALDQYAMWQYEKRLRAERARAAHLARALLLSRDDCPRCGWPDGGGFRP